MWVTALPLLFANIIFIIIVIVSIRSNYNRILFLMISHHISINRVINAWSWLFISFMTHHTNIIHRFLCLLLLILIYCIISKSLISRIAPLIIIILIIISVIIDVAIYKIMWILINIPIFIFCYLLILLPWFNDHSLRFSNLSIAFLENFIVDFFLRLFQLFSH